MKTPQERYLYKPFPGSSHVWAFAKLDKIDSNMSVLDVGPGQGVQGEQLKEKGVSELYAVEIDADARKHVEKIYKETTDVVENLQGKKFDLVLLLDVLEHMTDPFEYLKKIDTYLNPGAKVLISLPNIAHWSTRFALLFGFFEYTERGLLDKTHFNFFNKRRALKLASSVENFRLREYHVTSAPIEYFLPDFVWQSSFYQSLANIREGFINFFPGLFGYQHLLYLEKK